MNNFLSKSGMILGASLLGLMIAINFFAGIISGIWLAFLGNWGIIFYGLLISFLMPFVYSIASLPSMAIMPLLVKATESKSKFFIVFLGLINVLYSNALIVIWTYFVFTEFTQNSYGLAVSIPLLLWGYSTVIAPLAYMAKGEAPDSIGTSLGIFLAQIGYFLATVFWLFGFTYGFILLILIVLAILFSLFSITIVIKSLNKEHVNTKELNEAVDEFDEGISESTAYNNSSNILDAEIDELSKGGEDDEDGNMYTFCTCGKKLEWKKPNSIPTFCKFCGNKLT